MAKTTNFKVDYNLLFQAGDTIRGAGQVIESKINGAWGTGGNGLAYKVSNMGLFWKGKRYNELVGAFNKIYPILKETIILIKVTLPDTLQQIANNYAEADTGSIIKAVSSESVADIPAQKIEETNELLFNEEIVQERKEAIMKDLQMIINELTTTGNITSCLIWDGEVAKLFEGKFDKLIKTLENSFTQLQSTFDEAMKAAISDIENAEKASTI